MDCEPGTFVQAYAYDNLGRLARRRTTVDGSVVYEEALSRDLLGRIATKTRANAGNPSVTFEYGYDVDGQLDNVLRDGILYEKYSYDLNGNRKSAMLDGAVLQDNVLYDAQDRETMADVTFDADGFMMRRGTRGYAYSARGELLVNRRSILTHFRGESAFESDPPHKA